jgi:GPH family glycoside/pentoside/hexuronide:cation symporter
MSNKTMKPTKPLHYAVGMFGTSIPINMFKTFAAVFYIDRLGFITTKQFALITFIYTFVDAVDNPVYGFLSDRTHTKWGRRRPWLLPGSLLLVLCFILFFSPPQFMAPGSMFSYVLIMYLLTGTLDSMINSNYGALFPEIFKTEKDRAKTNMLRQVFQLTAMVLSIALTPVITGKIGFTKTALIYGALAIVVIWFMTLNSHEDFSAMEKPKPSLISSLRAVAVNPKFWIYGAANASFTAAMALLQAGVPFYVKYYLHASDKSTTVMLGTAIISAILFIPVWFVIIKKIKVMPSWRLSFIIFMLGLIPLYFTGTVAASTAFVLLPGFGIAGIQVTMDIVSARILDEDSAKYGIQREGVYSSLIGVLNKTYNLFSSLGYLLVYKLYGFESGNNPGGAPDDASRFLTVLFPVALMAVCVISSRFLKFSEPEDNTEEAAKISE